MTVELSSTVAFVRIPKNASTTLYHHLGAHNAFSDEALASLMLTKARRYLGTFAPSHCAYPEAREITKLEPGVPTFAVIRNPLDRMVSFYAYATQYPELLRLYQDAPVEPDFDDFVDWFAAMSERDDFFHGWSQRRYLGADGAEVASLLRFERLTEDWADFVAARGLALPVELPRLNASKHGQWPRYYNTRTKRVVMDLWAEDFDTFVESANW